MAVRKLIDKETSKRNNYLKSAIRRVWRWSKARAECLRSDTCVACKKKTEKLFADHRDPVVNPLTGFRTWDEYIDRMFNGRLDPLCGPCHSKKSEAEGKIRRAQRAANQANKQ